MKQASPEEIAARVRMRMQFPLPEKEAQSQIIVHLRIPQSKKDKFDEKLEKDRTSRNRLLSAFITEYVSR